MKSKYLIALLSPVIFSCKEKKEGYLVKEQTINEAVYASGEIEPVEFYEMKSATPDRILHAYVRPGEQVKRGQLLAVLGNASDEGELAAINKTIAIAKENSGTASARLKDMALRIRAAEEKYNTDRANAARYERLSKTGAVSLKEAEQYQAAATSSLAESQSLQQQYNSLKNELEISLLASEQQKSQVLQTLQRRRLTSPVAGTVLSQNFREGEMLPADEVLYTIGNDSSYILRLWVDERDISKVKTGQQVAFETDARQGQQFAAEVFEINPVIQSQTRSFEVKAKVTVAGVFYPKSSVEANIAIRSQVKTLVIPAEYLVSKDTVYVQRNDKTEKIKIIRGVQNDNWIEVKGGLNAGDIIEKVN